MKDWDVNPCPDFRLRALRCHSYIPRDKTKARHSSGFLLFVPTTWQNNMFSSKMIILDISWKHYAMFLSHFFSRSSPFLGNVFIFIFSVWVATPSFLFQDPDRKPSSSRKAFLILPIVHVLFLCAHREPDISLTSFNKLCCHISILQCAFSITQSPNWRLAPNLIYLGVLLANGHASHIISIEKMIVD